MEALAAQEAVVLVEEVAVALTEEAEGDEEVVAMAAVVEAWIVVEAKAEMAEAWVALDLATPGLVTGSVNCVETPTLLGGRSATSVRRPKVRIPAMLAKEVAAEVVEALEGDEEEDLVEAGVVALEIAEEEVEASGVTEVVVEEDLAVVLEVTVVEEAVDLVAVEVEALVGTEEEGEVVSAIVVAVAEDLGVIGVVAP